MSDFNLFYDSTTSESDVDKVVTIELSNGLVFRLPFKNFTDLSSTSSELISRLERIVSISEL